MADLKVPCSQEFIEEKAILVHEAMSGSNRRFHTPEHIFQIIQEEENPILVLAALFHDIVYYNVDAGFTSRVEELVEPYVTREIAQVFIRRNQELQDPVMPLLLGVFGFRRGQLLSPFAGLNEFLSAIVFARLFYPILPIKDLLGVLACIEASLPFRKPDEQGKSCFRHLEERLNLMNQSLRLGLSEDDLIELTVTSVKFANLDVGNFGYEETVVFLDNTWKLLHENNAVVLGTKVYTIKNYRIALEKMEGFFHRVDTNAIFHQYRNEPSFETFFQLRARAQKNVELAKSYLAGRLLSMAVLESLCELTGGDAPVVMLMGSRGRDNSKSKAEFNDLIRKVPVKKAKDVNEDVLGLLEYEALLVSILDFRKTPLTAFIYKCIGQQRMLDDLVIAKDFFAGKINAAAFVEKMDPYMVKSIAVVCSQMISTRKDKFLAVAGTHKKSKVKKKVA
ncbi:MAG: hypothetical protein RJB66_2746 [Pseudomonadota bacterium]